MRSPLPVFRRSLIGSWRSTLGWTIGLSAAILIYLPLYPSIAGPDMMAMLESLPPELVNALGYTEVGTGPGYTQATFFGLVGFALFAIAAIGWGAAAVGGAEESGRLELDLAHGIGRVPYALEQALAIVVRLLVLGALSGALILAVDGPAQLDLDPAGVLWAVLALTGLSMLAASAAALAGAITGRRVWGVGIGSGIAVAGYALNAVANQTEDAEWLRSVSPYAWAYQSPPLTDGGSIGIAALWALSAVLVAAAAWALQRRDILG